jgi:hypothetical protein
MDNLSTGWVLLTYSPMIVAAVVMVTGAIIEAFQHAGRND